MSRTYQSYLNRRLTITLVIIFCLFFWGTEEATCPAGQYLNATSSLCLNCSLTCATCSSPTACLTCKSALVNSSTTTWWSWWGWSGCICATSGTYYSPTTGTCSTCSVAVPKCATCTAGVNGVICSTCSAGTYKANATSCVSCAVGCSVCTSATACTTCATGYTLVSGVCTMPCSSLIAQCSTCTTSLPATCTACKAGFYLSANACVTCGPDCATCNITGCITCSVGFLLTSSTCTDCATALSVPGCTKCSSTLCTACLTSSGYVFNATTNLCDLTGTISCLSNEVLIAGSCHSCSTAFNPQCTTCTPTACAACSTGYSFNSTTSTCNIICNSNEVAIGGVCTLCSTVYNVQCTQCSAISCTACTTGFFYNSTSIACQINPTSSICGDGDWIETLQACDDGNSNNLDGCDVFCQIQLDYSCLVADKLPSGASFCKFTKNITIVFSHIQKQTSSNIAHVFFNILPPTFQQWNSQQLQNLINPVTVVDQTTGTSITIPVNSINYVFQRLNGQNQLQLIIDYDGQSIESRQLKFNLDPTATNLPAINLQITQPLNYVKLGSFYNAVNLYSYTASTYEFQNSVSVMAMFLGYLALLFAVLGLLCPVGKLIVVEALAVIQLSFFSILQFKKIPPTFIGFRNLIFSNGYNNPNLFESSITQNDQTLFKLMGLNQSIFVNYNISFIMFFWVPFLIGLVGLIVCSKGKPTQSKREITDDLFERKEQNTEMNKNETQEFATRFKLIVFKRIFYEVSFYGILLTGYLTWVSVFSGIKDDYLLNTIGSVVITLIWLFFEYNFIVQKASFVDLKQNKSIQKDLLNETNIFVMDGFGEFKQVRTLVSKDLISDNKVDRFYAIFTLQRIVTSLVIAYFSTSIYCSTAIITIYAVFLLSMILISRKFQSSKNQDNKTTMLSYLFRNYTLRQSFNFITIISIQIVILGSQLAIKSSEVSSDVLSANKGIVKLVPMLILCLILVNLVTNIFLWVWQIKNSQILQKAKQIKKLCSNDPEENVDDEKQQGVNSSNRQISKEEEEVSAAMGKIMETIISQTPKKSPFIGIEEKESRAKFKVPKMQNMVSLQQNELKENDGVELNKI